MREDGVKDMDKTKKGRCEARNVEDIKPEDPILADDCNDKRKYVTEGEDTKGGRRVGGRDENEKAIAVSQTWIHEKFRTIMYPNIIIKADNAAATLQYHGVASFSMYKSISVRSGCHLGNGGDIAVSFAGVLLRTLRQVSILAAILDPLRSLRRRNMQKQQGQGVSVSRRDQSHNAPLLKESEPISRLQMHGSQLKHLHAHHSVAQPHKA